MHSCFSKKNIAISLLTLLTIAVLLSCKKDKDVTAPPKISYQQKNISIPLDQQMVPVRPDSTGGPITEYSIRPSLPKGISLNKTSGMISGMASDTLTPSQFIVTANGPGGAAYDTLTIAIGTVGFNYGNNPNYVFTTGDATLSTTPLTPTIIAGTFTRYMISSPFPDSVTLKTGLSFDPATGKFSGTANKLTSTTASPVAVVFTVTGITANNKAASATVKFTVNDVAPAFYYGFKGSLATGVNYVDSTSAVVPGNIPTPITPTSTGVPVKAYRLASGSPALPAGLSLDSTNGRIYGNPTTAGTTNVVITALSAGGANPTNFTVPVVITATVQAPMISYAMVVTNKAISTAGAAISVTDTLVSAIPSNGTMYLTNNASTPNLFSNGGYQGAMSGTALNFIPVTTQGQVSTFGALSPSLATLGVPNPNSTSGIIASAVPKVTAASGVSNIVLNNAVPNGAAGSYTFNYQSNAPYVAYSSAAGNVGSTKFSSGRNFGTYPATYFFIKGRAIDAAPNGTDSCYYTAAQLAPSTATATSYSIYPAQMLPGLSFNTTTGAISGTPTMTTIVGSLYQYVTYTIVGRKADGSFTMCNMYIKVFNSASEYMLPSLYP